MPRRFAGIPGNATFEPSQIGDEVHQILDGDLDRLLKYSFINYPNPFTPLYGGKTTIRYMLFESMNDGEINIFTDTGELVWKRNLESGELNEGTHEIAWDGRDYMYQPLGRGVYFAVLKLGGSDKHILKIAIY